MTDLYGNRSSQYIHAFTEINNLHLALFRDVGFQSPTNLREAF